MIDWKDPGSAINSFFMVREAIWLPQWGRLANEADGLNDDAKKGIIELLDTMVLARKIVEYPIYSHCCFRPEAYNKLVGGAEESAHIARKITRRSKDFWIAAIDFEIKVPGKSISESCEVARQKLLPHLEELGLRMENNGALAPWVHLDNKPLAPGGHRVF